MGKLDGFYRDIGYDPKDDDSGCLIKFFLLIFIILFLIVIAHFIKSDKNENFKDLTEHYISYNRDHGISMLG